MNNTHIFRIEKSDRYITILTDGGPQGGCIIGMNFQQGLDEPPTSIDTNYDLTDYVNKRLVEDDHSTYIINPEFDQWLEAIDSYIWDWWNLQNEPYLNEIPIPILEAVVDELEISIEAMEEHPMSHDDLDKLQSLKRFVALMSDNHGVFVSKTKTEFVNNLK